MKAQAPHDPIVSDLGRSRSIKRQEQADLDQKPGLTYNAAQQYYNGFPRKAKAHTHQMHVKAKGGWQQQDSMQRLSAPTIQFRQDHFFKSVREAVRFGQQAKIPVKQRCGYNNLNFFRPIQASEQMAMSQRENPVVKREGIGAKSLRGSDSVALNTDEDTRRYVNFMDEPMTPREIALLKQKALRNNPRVLSTIRRLHQLAVAIRENELQGNGNGDGGEPGAPPMQQARSVSKPYVYVPTAYNGETKDNNRVDTDSDDDDSGDGDNDAILTSVIDRLESSKSRYEPLKTAEIETFVNSKLPRDIIDGLGDPLDRSNWTLEEYVSGLRNMLKRSSPGHIDDETRKALSTILQELNKLNQTSKGKSVDGDKIDAYVIRQLPQSIKRLYLELGDKSDWGLSEFIAALTTLGGAVMKEEASEGKVVKEEGVDADEQLRVILQEVLNMIESQEFRDLPSTQRSKRLRKINTEYDLGLPRAGSSSVIREIKLKMEALSQ